MKTLNKFINESLVRESINKEDIENMDMRLEELRLERSEIYPANKVPYKSDSEEMEWLEEMSDSVVKRPFDNVAKKVLKAFKIDPNNVEVFRHVAAEVFDYAELIIYTTKGESPEGEDHGFAVEDIFLNEGKIDLANYINENIINEGPTPPQSSIWDLDRSEVIAELDEVLFSNKKIQDKTLRAYKTMPLENVLDKFDLWDELSKRLYGFDKKSIKTYLDRNREYLDEYFYDNYNL